MTSVTQSTALHDELDRTAPDLGEATGETYPQKALTAHIEARANVSGSVRDVWRWDATAAVGAVEGSELTASEQLAAELIAAGEPTFHPAKTFEPPPLTGNLISDTCNLTGLTRATLASAFGVKERTIFNWQRDGAPAVAERRLRALRTIAITLFGGLGVDGMTAWLEVDEPPRLARLCRGDSYDDVVAEARAYVNDGG
jgi:hypothetical protein